MPSGEKDEIMGWDSAKEGWSVAEVEAKVDWERPLSPLGYKLEETFSEGAMSNG